MSIGGPAFCAQVLGALLGGGGLRQHAGGGAEFSLCLLGLQFQIDFIEGCQRLTDVDRLADFHQAFRDLPRHAKTHVGLDPGLDRADETALRRLGLVMHGSHQNRPGRHRFFRGRVSAAGQRNRNESQ